MTISEHAVEQYLSRIRNSKEPSAETKLKARLSIEKAVLNGKEAKLSPREELKRLLNNHCEPVKYVYNSGVLYVVKDNAVITCYSKKKKELIFDHA